MKDFAVVESGGKQYKVAAGQKIKTEKVAAKEGGDFHFDKVLLLVRGDKAEIGEPYLNHKVEGKVIRAARDKKKIVFRYHSKTRYRKMKGHRQHYTEIEIVRI